MDCGIFIGRGLGDYNSPRVENDDRRMPMSFAFIKVNDGLEYRYFAPNEFREHVRIYSEQNIGVIPWGVGRGFSLDSAANEGVLAAEIAAEHQGCYILDLEPYRRNYWQGIPGSGRAFCEAYRVELSRRGFTPELHLVLDVRQAEAARLVTLDEFREFETVLNIRYWTQDYGTEFYPRMFAEQALERGYDDANRYLLSLGIPPAKIWPVLPCYSVILDDDNNRIGEPALAGGTLRVAIESRAARGHPGVAIWRRGLFDHALRDFIKQLPDPFNPSPPDTNTDDIAATVVQIQTGITNTQNAVAEGLNNIQDGVRKLLDIAIRQEQELQNK